VIGLIIISMYLPMLKMLALVDQPGDLCSTDCCYGCAGNGLLKRFPAFSRVLRIRLLLRGSVAW
jgi:hypothetical protein